MNKKVIIAIGVLSVLGAGTYWFLMRKQAAQNIMIPDITAKGSIYKPAAPPPAGSKREQALKIFKDRLYEQYKNKYLNAGFTEPKLTELINASLVKLMSERSLSSAATQKQLAEIEATL